MRLCLVCAFTSVEAARISAQGKLEDAQESFQAYPTVPSGVNFGGWLVLEDWFHSGNGKFVSTPKDKFPDGQGACLPPALTQHDTRWQSEGSLVRQLVDKKNEEYAIEVFTKHRSHYITDADLDAVASAGIKHIRIPVSWAMFPDALHDVDPLYTSFSPDHETRVVPDPYYKDTHAMVTIPRGFMAEILRKCADRGLNVVWDIHSFPGGTSRGTFNGIWPQKPAMWTHNPTFGNKEVKLRDVGVQVALKLIEWVKNLPAKEQSAVLGISPMNEPAHLAWGNADWGSHTDVLEWYAEVASGFKASGLADKGVKFYVMLISTAFPDWGANFLNITHDWYNKVFTEEEQKAWAVMDRHWYTAWSGTSCSGRIAGADGGGAYSCNATDEEIREKLEGCMRPWAEDFQKYFPHLKAISEFSIGTFHEADKACKNKRAQDIFLDLQVKTWNEFNIQPFFWTWRMPYGPEFEPGWSLKYILGLEDKDSILACERPIDDKYIAPSDESGGAGTKQVE